MQPYGVTFDAFLIVDKNGMPQPLEKFYDDKTKNYEVDSENYLKCVAMSHNWYFDFGGKKEKNLSFTSV